MRADTKPEFLMRSRNSRHGFTLVELMIVVGIIALLVAIMAMALRGFTGAARESATRATLQKIDGLLNDRMNAFHRRAPDRENLRLAMMEGFQSRDDAEIYARKLNFREAFPQSFDEARTLLAQANRQPPASVTPNPTDRQAVIQNAQVLYFFLTQSSVVGFTPETDDAFTGAETATEPGEPDWPYFVDAWGNPITFVRWPTRLVKPDGTTTNRQLSSLLIKLTRGMDTFDLNIDPDDPTGTVQSVVQANGLHTTNTFHTPLVVSAGPDGELGLHPPILSTSATHFGHLGQPLPNPDGSTDPHPALYDNITNRN